MSDEMTPLDSFVKRAQGNYDRVISTPQNMAHVDQGAAMWRRMFEENGLILDPISARVVILALGVCGARAATQLEDGEAVNWACAEASMYVVPALSGSEGVDLEDLILLDPDTQIEVTWKWDWAKLVKHVGFGVYAVTAGILAWRNRG